MRREHGVQSVRRVVVLIAAAVAGIALMMANIDSIIRIGGQWIHPARQSGHPAAVRTPPDTGTPVRFSFPMIRALPACDYTPLPAGSDGLVDATLYYHPMSQMPEPPTFGGTISGGYRFAFAGHPREGEGKVMSKPPEFELVCRNDDDHAVVVSAVGVRLIARRSRPLAGPLEPVAVPVRFDHIVIAVGDLRPGQQRIVEIAPVALQPGSVSGFDIGLDEWQALAFHVIQFLLVADGQEVAAPEIFVVN